MTATPDGRNRLISDTTLEEYFQGSLDTALNQHRVQADDATVHYVVRLLISFLRSDSLYERTPEGYMIRPLASFYAEALEGPGDEARRNAMRRLGDVALFIAGVFSDSLNRKAVDVDYYIAMGGSAYGYLSSTLRGSPRGQAYGPIFDELAQKFGDFVEVLGEVSDRSALGTDRDVLRTYELWVRTGSPRARRQLRHLGIEPAAANVSRSHH
jgi:hypothetical protein